MLVRAISGYWILYVMMGICAIGVISRLWLAGIYSGLLKDVQYTKEPKKKLVKQMKEKYETCYQLSEGISNMEAFLVRNLYGYRFMGMTLGEIQKISGQAFFLCLLAGGAAGGYAYANGMPLEITGIYSASAVAMATLLLYINCVFDAQGRQVVLEAGIIDYLQNYLSPTLDRRKDMSENVEIVDAEELQEELQGERQERMQEKIQEERTDRIERADRTERLEKLEKLEKLGKLGKPEKEDFKSESRERRSSEKRSALFRRKEQKYKPEEENTSAKEQAERLLFELRKNPRGGKEFPQDLQEELESLRDSLNQIAVDLEKGRSGENRQLAEEEMRIVEEILGEFLA